ncbi:FxLYD domain-containing protein [Leptothoe sp. ISB3NOV94-8A]
MGREQIIETYIQRLLAWEEPLTADKLSALAAEVGLSSEDVAAVQQKAQDHLERGRNYLDFDCLDEAITELTQATALDPLNFESLQTLTYAYDQRYGKHKHIEDKQQAIALAKRCLELNPSNEDAVMLISALEHEVSGRQRLLWFGLAGLLLLGGLKFTVDTIVKRSEIRQLTQDAVLEATPGQPSSQTPDRPSAAPNTAAEDIAIDTPGTGTAVDIPISFDQPGVVIEPRLSRLDNYTDSSYYTLQGVVLNDSDQEIDSLQLQIEYLNKDGVAIATDSTDAIAENDATVRPGDSHAFDLIQKITPELTDVRLNLTTIDEVPAPPNYAQAPPIDYTWSFQQPTQVKFALATRSENFNLYDLTDSAFFDAEWSVTNTGDSAIRKLKLQASFYNTNGELILNQDILAVYGSDAPMLPGEVRPVRVIKSIEQDYARYEVTVLEAE